MNDKKTFLIGVALVLLVLLFGLLCYDRYTDGEPIPTGNASTEQLENTANAIETGIGRVETTVDDAIESIEDAIGILETARKDAESGD